MRQLHSSALILFVAVCLASCASGNSNTTDQQDTAAASASYDKSLSKGQVIDTVVCNADKNNSYALCLPSYYTDSNPFPVVFFFDAHARGSLPVHRYRELAEKYGFVIASSNVSKNGMQWNETENIANTMITDVRSRVNTDAQRVYLSGFSGGARIACDFAVNNSGIAGVIGCGAGFPELRNGLQRKFDYIGIVGEYDFNHTEMQQLDNHLQKAGFTHQLLTFNGIHSWPPFADMETALLWMQVNAMREHLQPVNDTVIKALRNEIDKRINASDDPLRKQRLIDGAIKIFEGTDKIAYEKQLEKLVSGTSYKRAVSLQGQLLQQEQTLQQQISQAMANTDLHWWSNRISEINRNIKTGKPEAVSNMYHRVLSYLSLMCYLYIDKALQTGNLDVADSYLRIFKLADPKNPDVAYLTAIYFVSKGDEKMALNSLKEAAQLGYNDVGKLRTETAFVRLHEDTTFRDIEKIMLGNTKR